MAKLAIIVTHPIQYYVPIFNNLSSKMELCVFYTWHQWQINNYDKEFRKEIIWDIPLLEGYVYEFVINSSKSPDLFKYSGIKNPELIPKIKAFAPNAILVFGWCHQSHLKVMRYFKGKIPVWFRGDSTLLDYDYKSIKNLINYFGRKPYPVHLAPLFSYLKFRMRTLFLRWVYSHVTKSFYVGAHNKSYYLHHGLKEGQLIFAPHAVDNERFLDNDERQYEKLARQWRRKLQISDESLVVLFAGKLDPVKNPWLLIDAVIKFNEEQKNIVTQTTDFTNQPKNKFPEEVCNHRPANKERQRVMHLILVGSGMLEKELITRASGKSYIHFLPFQNQSLMPIIYRLGDIFCLPSRSETWGLSVNEAFACSRPALVSDKVGCNPDLVHEGVTGFTFINNNVEDLYGLLKKINKKTIDTLAKSASKEIQDYSIRRIAVCIETSIKT